MPVQPWSNSTIEPDLFMDSEAEDGDSSDSDTDKSAQCSKGSSNKKKSMVRSMKTKADSNSDSNSDSDNESNKKKSKQKIVKSDDKKGGINTVGSSLKNASYDLKLDPKKGGINDRRLGMTVTTQQKLSNESITQEKKSLTRDELVKQIFDMQNFDGSFDQKKIIKYLNLDFKLLRKSEDTHKAKPKKFKLDSDTVFICVYLKVYLEKKYLDLLGGKFKPLFDKLKKWIKSNCSTNQKFLEQLFKSLIN